MTDPRQRRALLATAENPRRTRDMLLEHQLRIGPHEAALRYVPDHLVLDIAGSRPYFDALGGLSGSELALAAFEDINSELVPRWLALRVGGNAVAVVLQEARPTWANPALLACLRPW
jgi:hypothetical protein